MHQALYSLRNTFQPAGANPFGFSSCSLSDPGSAANFGNYDQGPLYVPPEDPNYFSNLDRLLEAITPRVSCKQLETTSVADFFKAFKRSSVFGLRIEMLNEQSLESELFTFTPTLSSLVLSYTRLMSESRGERLNRVLDFTDQACADSRTAAPEVDPVARGSSSSGNSQPGLTEPQIKFIEVHETEPHY